MHNSSVLPSTPASVNGMSPHCHLTFKQTHKHQVYSRFPCTHKPLFFNLLNYILSNTTSCVPYYATLNYGRP